MTTRMWNGGRRDGSDPSRWSAADTGGAGAHEPGDTAAIPRGSVALAGVSRAEPAHHPGDVAFHG